MVIDRISWLHLSDLHLKAGLETWAQDVVLAALTRDIQSRKSQGLKVEFVLVTGDIAFSGQEREYAHAISFLDKLCSILELPRSRVFCVPGNHDVDLKLQTTCHAGAKQILQNEEAVDEFLGNMLERSTLLQRQAAYQVFEREWSKDVQRWFTPDELAYVANLDYGSFRLSILGINSAWLCDAGDQDHGKVLIGERQVIDAVQLVRSQAPHLVVAMAHHPWHWLREFDRLAVQRWLIQTCAVFHRGHLHTEEVVAMEQDGAKCVLVAAGATYETRTARHSYNIMALDLGAGLSIVTHARYDNGHDCYNIGPSQAFALTIQREVPWGLTQLAQTISAVYPELKTAAYYLAALVHGDKAEVPTTVNGDLQMLPVETCLAIGGAERTLLERFMSLRNLLRLQDHSAVLKTVLTEVEDRLKPYGEFVVAATRRDHELEVAILARDHEARSMASLRPERGLVQTRSLMNSLLTDGDWPNLRQIAERALGISELSECAMRMIAITDAHSDDPGRVREATTYFTERIKTGNADASDFACAAQLFMNQQKLAAARETTIQGAERFPEARDIFAELASTIAIATGDKALAMHFHLPATGGKK